MHKEQQGITQSSTDTFFSSVRTLCFVLSLLEAIATSASFRIATARVADVNFSERTVVARSVVFAFRNAATDSRIDFLIVIIHHNTPP